MKNNIFQTIIAVVLVAIIQSSYAQNPILINSSTGASTTPGASNSIITQNASNIGIGFINPASKLEVSYAGSETGLILTKRMGAIGTAGNPLTIRAESLGTNFSSVFTTLFTVNNAGKVGVMNATPTAQLDIKAANTTTAPLLVSTSAGAVSLTSIANGNVGIGTVTPTVRLEVSGNTKIANLAANTTTPVLTIENNGTTGGNILLKANNSSVPNKISFANAAGAVQHTITADAFGMIINPGVDNVSSKSIDINGQTNLVGNALVTGNTEMRGNVSIGTQKPTGTFANFALSVDGNIVSKKSIVQTSSWADKVFEKDYKLMPLSEVMQFVNTYKHLPEIPSEKQVIENGVDVGEMNKLLLQKIEELTLYLIQMEKKQDAVLEAMRQYRASKGADALGGFFDALLKIK